MPVTFFTHLRCSICGAHHDAATPQTVCLRCGRPLLAEYDLAAVKKSLPRAELLSRRQDLWRYRELLPILREDDVVSLGEGWTPLVSAPRLAEAHGIPKLLIKEEAYNPTGSFKARGLAVAVSKARELGIRELAAPSAGNAGGALAAYAAKAGMKAHIFMPRDTPVMNITETRFFGADVHLVDGLISDASREMTAAGKGAGWFDLSTMKEPYRVEGKKTMGFELAEQLSWTLPDVIIYPTGGGTGLVGMWKAFRELEELGWIGPERPRMVAVQAAGCAPVVKAFREGRRTAEFWEGAFTFASGLRVPKPFADDLILSILRESGGTAVEVTDREIADEFTRSASIEGWLLCPEGAAAVAAAGRLRKDGFLKAHETVVVFNTASAYKYIEVLAGLQRV